MTVRMPTLGEIRLDEHVDVLRNRRWVRATYRPDRDGPVFRGEAQMPTRHLLATEYFQVRGRAAAEAMDDVRTQVAAHRAATLPYPND